MTAIDIRTLTIRVHDATPAPQGSFFAVLVAGRPQVVADNKATKPWRAAVAEAARTAMTAAGGWTPTAGATHVEITFTLQRPKTVKRTLPFVRPDIDKLARSTLDALTQCDALTDDATVCDLVLRKRYADQTDRPGATIRVTPIDDLSGPGPINGDESDEGMARVEATTGGQD